MILARASVRRPVFTLMVALIVIVIGASALGRLRIDLLPSIELPTISVRTSYTGADPLVMERLVTRIVEEIIGTVPGVVEMTSRSYEGNSRISVSFAWGTNVDQAALDVRATLEDEINELPDEIGGVRVGKFDIDSFPVVLIGISSQLDPVELTEMVENEIRNRLSRIPGVAQVDPWGGYNREVRIELDPQRIDALGLSLNEVLQAIRDANVDLPAGKIEEGTYQLTLRAPAEFSSLDQIRDTVIGRQDDNLVTVRQIARVIDTYQELSRIVRVNGEQGLRIAIRKLPGENTVDVARRVLGEIESLNADMPLVNIIPVINQGNFIERSIENVSRSVLYGGGLAVLVLFLFLRSLRSTLVISLAIPISVIATFAMLYLGGFTLNLMSLGGLALGIGMMVDSSVVIMENIYRRRVEIGESAEESAIRGAGEVGPAVLAGTMTTLVIFLPLIFIQGVTGVLFRELAYVVMFALFCALVVSLSLVPMLSARLPGGPNTGEPRDRNESWGWAVAGYRDLLASAVRFRALTVIIAAALFTGSLVLLDAIGKEFMPPSDEGEVRVSGEMAVGTRMALIDAQTQLLEEKVFAALPERVASVTRVSTSGTFGRSQASGEIRISLPPASERGRSNTQIASDLREVVDGQIPGMNVRVRAPQGQFLLERILPNSDGVTVEVTGFDLDTLVLLAARARDAVDGIPGVTDTRLSRERGIPQQEILIDREKAAALGLSVRDVAEVIETAIAGTEAGEFRIEGNAYPIRLQLENARQRSLDEVLNLVVRTPGGELVVLRNLIDTSRGSGPVTIERKNQQRIVTLEVNIDGRDTGSVAEDVEAALRTIAVPTGYGIRLSGNYEEQEKAFSEMLWTLLLALALVYMVLAAQYESFLNPLIVMFSVPFAATGAIVTLLLTDTTLNLQSGIGCIMLGGVVVNNAILLVDQANRNQRDGMHAAEAAVRAGMRRLRPVLMTTLTTILALLPLAFGIGEGADAQAPMARAVVGGLAVSTLVTLLLIPATYAIAHAGLRTSPPIQTSTP